MNTYKVLSKQIFEKGDYSIVPIRFEDRYWIMKWRNEQIYHLRQNKPLTKDDQDNYFEKVISSLFHQDQPSQLLFSFLKGDKCIGYGGLVHINWIDKNAEISFIIDTELEQNYFEKYWLVFLELIEELGFNILNLHKIFTYAFDLRPQLYSVLEKAGFINEAILSQHAIFEDMAINVYIHSKNNINLYLKKATIDDANSTYRWATDAKVRNYSFNKDLIEFDEHYNWFVSKIHDQSCYYFILCLGGQKIGSIRVDVNFKFNEGLISYLIDSRFHGKGFGKVILKLLEERILSDLSLKSFVLKGLVMHENIASVRIFEKLNYSFSKIKNGVYSCSKIIEI
ncbi:GNAT family N-acetyltransferase [Belliella sp. R4-6]|uniref:GNAT family N-acetyltransferase n=1 Tax=Belliella alkalica TaxID=1730871 RepID=A0ABS9V6M7_9BACT|nr:GNAT family N-acetyltransferase [Belliella alkalica]MCH7412068.1 GNAT family N-acetyltransferase [Belliella alkalica]